MVTSPTVAIDLPMKTLIWEDDQGAVWISYNAPAYLQTGHDFPRELVQISRLLCHWRQKQPSEAGWLRQGARTQWGRIALST